MNGLMLFSLRRCCGGHTPKILSAIIVVYLKSFVKLRISRPVTLERYRLVRVVKILGNQFISKTVKDRVISGKFQTLWVIRTTPLGPLKNLELPVF